MRLMRCGHQRPLLGWCCRAWRLQRHTRPHRLLLLLLLLLVVVAQQKWRHSACLEAQAAGCMTVPLTSVMTPVMASSAIADTD